jgi:hypothetical protein
VGEDENIYLQEKPMKGVASATTTSWVWFDRMDQILESMTKIVGTPKGD